MTGGTPPDVARFLGAKGPGPGPDGTPPPGPGRGPAGTGFAVPAAADARARGEIGEVGVRAIQVEVSAAPDALPPASERARANAKTACVRFHLCIRALASDPQESAMLR